MKYIRIGALIILSLIVQITGTKAMAAQAGGQKVQVVYDGEVKKPVRLAQFSGQDFFSLRDVGAAYGGRVVYHPVTGKVAFSMNNRRLDIYVKSTRVLIDGQKKRLSSPSRLVAGELFIPVSFVLGGDFARFSEAQTRYNPDSAILDIERATNVSQPRFYAKPDSTKIVIELEEDLPYDWKQGKDGIMTVSFQRGRLTEEKVVIGDGVIKGFEAKNIGRQAKINIALDKAAGPSEAKYLEAQKKLVIIVAKNTGEETNSQTLLLSTTAFAEPELASGTTEQFEPAVDESSGTRTAILVPLAAAPKANEASPKKRKLLILDAGHGGDDPGAVGPNGTKEKDVNLKIVYELKKVFEDDGRYDVLLSRTDDTFIPLVERTSFANDKKADMFISVHCNASIKRESSGFEIYFLSEDASDSDAAATAVLENSVVRLEGKPSKKRARLQELLWSMTVNEFINESAELCSIIAGEVTRRIRIENRGVKQAGFFVLRGAVMPAVLVESAFISNYGEESKLRSKKFQSSIADSIFEGVVKYDERQENLNAQRQSTKIFRASDRDF